MAFCKVIGITAILFLGCALAIDLKSAVENKCFKVKPVEFDWYWASEQPTFYMPMVSRSKLYKVIAQMLKPLDASKIVEGTVYYDSCIGWKVVSNTSIIISGYDGKKTNYILGLSKDGDEGTFKPDYDDNGFSGTWVTSSSDGKTYAVFVICSNNEISWAVVSTTPTLPTETLEYIVKHLTDLGFKEEFFTELRYCECK